jgi:hypothetical protein
MRERRRAQGRARRGAPSEERLEGEHREGERRRRGRGERALGRGSVLRNGLP